MDRNKKARRLRRTRVASGLCPLCGGKAYNGGRNCRRHTAYFRMWGRRNYAKKSGRPVPPVLDARVHHAPGVIKSPEYHAYTGAKGRCNNPRNRTYYCYGGRGIKFLFSSFEQLFDAVGKRPSPKHSLDRKNNNGNYEPGNVRWATTKEQRQNKRHYAAIETFSNAILFAECKRRGFCLTRAR